MATQGIISITSKGKVLMKIIAGCNGNRAQEMGEALEKKWPQSSQEVYETARNLHMGCTSCLVVMTDSEIVFLGSDTPGPLYREKFQEPKFNPRWEHGSADCIILIEVPQNI